MTGQFDLERLAGPGAALCALSCFPSQIKVEDGSEKHSASGLFA